MSLTFGQEQGFEALPPQAQQGEITQRTRAKLWSVIASWFDTNIDDYSNTFNSLAQALLARFWVDYLERYIDDAPTSYDKRLWLNRLKSEVQKPFPSPYNLAQFVLRDPSFKDARMIAHALESTNASYRVVGESIVPFMSEDEHDTIVEAFRESDSDRGMSANRHLRQAADELRESRWPSAAHEAISAVEAAARIAAGDDKLDLRRAIKSLKNEGRISHGALAEMIDKLYGYGSDEKGVRHSLGSEGTSKVGEVEALMVFGVSASLVSYLLKV